jgi:tRNA-dihydrouridine synthase B
MKIGPHLIDPPVMLAPMAGVTDKPFRRWCRRLGAGLAVSEMTTDEARLWNTRKSRLRMDYADDAAPVSVQIAGSDPRRLAEAARHNAALGADIIDINMGCPAKKVCNVAAGSALLRDEALVGRILDAVVRAVTVPVTLKVRTGYARGEQNAVRIARLAEAAGIAAITVHGRTREDFFRGEAEFGTVAAVKSAVGIPVVANGDITSPQKAREVRAQTGCDAIMIGRGAQGRPWIFREVAHYLATGQLLAGPSVAELRNVVLGHLDDLYAHYGEYVGLRIARKHLGWYARELAGAAEFRAAAFASTSAADQRHLTSEFLGKQASLAASPERLAA